MTRLPRIPFFSLSPEDLSTLLAHPEYGSAEQDGRYLHWEELRHRAAPDGIRPELWWSAIRSTRAQLARPLQLNDSGGQPFTFAMTNTAQRLTHEVDRDASGHISLPEDIADPATRDSYIVSSLIEEAFRSSQLEGASTTREVAKEMIRTQRTPRTESEHMIFNNFYAMEWVREHRSEKLTRELVLELHRIVTRNTLPEDQAGQFRATDDVRVIDVASGDVVHVPPPAAQLSQRLDAMCQLANGTSRDEPFIHPVARAILLHFWLAYDHPFVDGNGRTARALFYWSMLHQGYWLTEFLSISRVINQARGRYDRAFQFAESDHNDATYFLLHQLQVLRTAIDDLHAYLKRKARDVRELADKLHDRGDLNHRQIAVLDHALRHPDEQLTIEGHRTMHRVVYQTARTDLLALVERGFLQQHKLGKKLFFTPVTGLARKLEPRKRKR